jgi:hypothetical protein
MGNIILMDTMRTTVLNARDSQKDGDGVLSESYLWTGRDLTAGVTPSSTAAPTRVDIVWTVGIR